jgi:acyl-CoA thioester hydrolase
MTAITDDYPYLREITLRWKDNDVYGHVNNVEYYSFFDTVINEFLILEGGLDIHGGAAVGLCAESHCSFAAAVAFPGRITAGLRTTKVGSSSVRYEIGLFDDAEPTARVAEGWFVHVFVDRESRRPTPIPAPIRAKLEEIMR